MCNALKFVQKTEWTGCKSNENGDSSDHRRRQRRQSTCHTIQHRKAEGTSEHNLFQKEKVHQNMAMVEWRNEVLWITMDGCSIFLAYASSSLGLT
jgi:hypothetical protein